MNDDQAHALRVSAALAVPGLALVAAGHPDLLIYAVFGFFAGMYGRTFGGSLRTRQQWRAAVLLVAGVAVGVSLAHLGAAPRILVAAETAFAVVASLLELRAALSRAGHRVAGTYAGLVLTAALLSLGLSPSLTPWR